MNERIDRVAMRDRRVSTRKPRFRLIIARLVIIGGLLAAIALAWPLWLDHPFFGSASVFGARPRMHAPWDWIALAAIALALIAGAVAPGPGRWVRVACLLLLARGAWDRMLWQPYLYQYLLMLIVLGFYGMSRHGGDRRPGSSRAAAPGQGWGSLACLQLIMIGVYFWSGVSKFNHVFLDEAPQRLFGPWLPENVVAAIGPWVWLIPAGETALALGLLFMRLRKAAVCGAIAMHMFILWMLGPFGLNHNHVVWPWNLAMIVLLPTLFWNVRETSPSTILGWQSPPVHRGIHAVVLVFCFVCPGLSMVGLWPSYLSFKLYAARQPQAVVLLSREAATRLPESARPFVTDAPWDEFDVRLNIVRWSEAELGAFAPPEVPVFRAVGRRFCEWAGAGEAALVVRSVPDYWTGEVEISKVTCDELQ